MITRLVMEFQCDAPHCLSKARVTTGVMAYGTNDGMERKGLEKRGWLIYGTEVYCRSHNLVGQFPKL